MAFVTPSVLFVSASFSRTHTSSKSRDAFVPSASHSRVGFTRSAFIPLSVAFKRSRIATFTGPVSAPCHPNGKNNDVFFMNPVATMVDGGDVSIASLLANPEGVDKGKEVITLRNRGKTDVSLNGWILRDHVEGTEKLSGIVPAGNTLSITLSGTGASLKNTREELFLINPAGVTVNKIRYYGIMGVGQTVDFDLSIAAMLPNPVGIDAGNETVTLRNRGWSDISLEGWSLKDHLGDVEELKGTVPAGGTLELTLSGTGAHLKNTGDDIYLINPSGIAISIAKYKGAMVPGQPIYFE